MTNWSVLLRRGSAPDPGIYRFTESIYLAFGQCLSEMERAPSENGTLHAFTTPALESVPTVALSSVVVL